MQTISCVIQRDGSNTLAYNISKQKPKPVNASWLRNQNLRATNHNKPTRPFQIRQTLKLQLIKFPFFASFTKPNLGPFAWMQQSQSALGHREGKHSVYCRCQARSPGSQCLKDLNSSKAIRETFLFYFIFREMFLKTV